MVKIRLEGIERIVNNLPLRRDLPGEEIYRAIEIIGESLAAI